jgi:tetratricopeptide (TPR) repeat protein
VKAVKIKKGALTALGIGLIGVALLGALYVFQRNRNQASLASRIAELGGRGTPVGIEDLREAIAVYEARIEEHVRDAAQTGIYWKILATRLADKGLHNDALDALERAAHYYPGDPALRYQVGVSAAMVAKSYLDFGDTGEGGAARYYALAEEGYLQAIRLDETYTRSYYALGVLYVFELDRAQDAIPYLEKFLELRSGDVDGMFVLARAYYMTGAYQPALDLYDRIIPLTRDPDKRSQAEKNKQAVMDIYYG